MSRRRRRVEPATLLPPVPEGFDETVAVVLAAQHAAVAARNGPASAKASRDDVVRWLLGDAAVAEGDRVLLDHARRCSRQRIRADQLRRDVWRGTYPKEMAP